MSLEDERGRIADANGWVEGGIAHIRELEENRTRINAAVGALMDALGAISSSGLLKETATMGGHYIRAQDVFGRAGDLLASVAIGTGNELLSGATYHVQEARREADNSTLVGSLSKLISYNFAPKIEELLKLGGEVTEQLERLELHERDVLSNAERGHELSTQYLDSTE